MTAGSSPTAATPVATAATGRPHWAVFLGLAASIVVADQLTKAWIVANIAPGEAIRVVGDLLRLVHSQNTGALFGLFRDNAILFGAASILVISLIVAFHGRAGRSLATSILLGLLLGGAIGNLIDRLRLGYVVDFVDAGIGDLRWYTFNVADAAISTAIVGLILVAIFPGVGEAVDRLGRRSPPAAPPVDG